MSRLANLPVYDPRKRCAPAKSLPHQLVKKAADKAKLDRGLQMRNEVWARDGGKSRATGRPLVRTGTTDWTRLGEVDHTIPRSLDPANVYRPSHALLLSKEENRLRKVGCPKAPQFRMFDYSGPKNRALPQRFVWRDVNGHITRETEG
jgi:5-methylcytosine-specific restriction endonuclease McrA